MTKGSCHAARSHLADVSLPSLHHNVHSMLEIITEQFIVGPFHAAICESRVRVIEYKVCALVPLPARCVEHATIQCHEPITRWRRLVWHLPTLGVHLRICENMNVSEWQSMPRSPVSHRERAAMAWLSLVQIRGAKSGATQQSRPRPPANELRAFSDQATPVCCCAAAQCCMTPTC